VWDVAFSPYGYYFLSGSADGFMILWKTDEPHAKRLYEHKNDVYKVSFAKDPAFVISAG
jgi:WD40 repeat protein